MWPFKKVCLDREEEIIHVCENKNYSSIYSDYPECIEFTDDDNTITSKLEVNDSKLTRRLTCSDISLTVVAGLTILLLGYRLIIYIN